MDGLTSELILQVVIAAGILAAIALGLFTYLILVIKKMYKSIEDFKGVRIIENLDRARRVEVEIPGLLGRITIPYEKLPDFLKTIGIPPWIVTGQTTNVEQKSGERDDRFLKLYEKLSGLEFSRETGRVKCPEHGWVEFKIDEDGRLVCNAGNHVLFDPIHKVMGKEKEVAELRTQLERLRQELDELKQTTQNKPGKSRREPGSSKNSTRENPSEE
jgi:F0F1-type ATP synthase membrane subunit b/b'